MRNSDKDNSKRIGGRNMRESHTLWWKRGIALTLCVILIFGCLSEDYYTIFSNAEGQQETQTSTQKTESGIENKTATTQSTETSKQSESIEEHSSVPVETESKQMTETLTETAEETDTETETETETEEAGQKKAAFDETKQIDGTLIHVKADGGVFPENAVLHVEKLANQKKIDKAENAINEELTENKKVQESYAFDITIRDDNGEEIQPDTTKGKVYVTFENIDTTEAENKNPDTGIEVYHVTDDCSSADAVDDSKVVAKDDEVTFEAEHFSLYVVVITGNDKQKEYTLTGSQSILQMLKDLINTKDVPDTITDDTVINSATSNNTEVLSVSGTGSDMVAAPVKAGKATLSVTYNTDITISIEVTIRSAVYLNTKNGNDENSGESNTAALKNWNTAVSKLTTSGKTHGKINLVESQVELSETKSIDPGTDSSLAVGRDSSFNGDMFSINGSGINVTFSNLTLEAGDNKDKNLISITSGNTLSIGENLVVEQGGIFAMQAAGGSVSNPIELLDMPQDGSIYTISCGDIKDGKVLVYTHGLEALSYFKLADSNNQSTNFELVYNTDGDIIAREKVAYEDSVYLDGVFGNDDNNGAEKDTAVKTYEKALELCKKQNISMISICGTVSVTKNTTWVTATVRGTKVAVMRASEFNDSLIKITNGNFTFTDQSPVINTDGKTGIEVSGGTFTMTGGTIEASAATMVDIVSGTMNMSGGTITSSSCGIYIGKNGTLNLSGAASIGSNGSCSVRNAGSFNLTQNTDSIKGNIELSGSPMTLKMSSLGSNTYSLKLSDFKDGDTVVDGGKVTSDSLAGKFKLTDTAGYIYRDTTADNMLYMSAQKEVYLDPINGVDGRLGRDAESSVKTLGEALRYTADSASINTIRIMNTVSIEADTTITDETYGLTIKPYGESVTKMFDVTAGALTLGRVSISGSSKVNSIYLNGGILETGEKTVLSGGAPDVLVKSGLFDMKKGEASSVELDDNDKDKNGTLKLYNDSKITDGIQITADTYYSAPIELGGNLTTNSYTIGFKTPTAFADKEIVTKGDTDSAANSLPRFKQSLEYKLEAGTGTSPYTETTSLYLKSGNGNTIYLKSAGSDDNKGLTRDTAVKTFLRAKELAAEMPDSNICICGEVDISGEETWEFDNGGTLSKNGHTWTPLVYRDSKYTSRKMIYVGNADKLVLNNITIDGNYVEADRPLIYVDGSGILNTNDGTILQNAVTNDFDYGGAFFYNSSAESIIKDTIISGNTGCFYGGVIYQKGGTLTIEGNTQISGNTNGGIYQNGGTLTIEGNTEICKNTGYGIYKNKGNTTIEGNTQISGNADSYGGGIYQLNGNLIVEGNTKINGNAVGIDQDSGTVTVSGNTEISGNMGNGIYQYAGNMIVTESTQINKNTCSGICTGGGNTGILTVEGNTKISGNRCNSGIYHSGGGTVTVKGNTEISENTGTNGGGIYLRIGTMIVEENAKIIGNTGTNGGGIYQQNGIMIVAGNAAIIGNTATSGGGIYMNGRALTVAGNTKISGNTANDEGGGIFQYVGNLIFEGGHIFNNEGEDEIHVNNKAKKRGTKLKSNQTRIDGIISAPSGTIEISEAFRSDGNSYQMRVDGGKPGTVAVKPDGTNVTDASQYLSYFSSANTGYSLDKSGVNIVLSNSIYVNGQTGNDSAVGAGKSPAIPRKTLPSTLAENTIYYICGAVETGSADLTITGTTSSRIVRYTGFDVGGVPYEAYGGDLFKVMKGTTLTLSNVALAGKRSPSENYTASGYLVRNNGSLKISDGTTMTDNKKGCVFLADGKWIDADNSAPGTQNSRVTVDMENPATDAFVVKGESGNTNISKFSLVPRLSGTYTLNESGNNLVIAGAKEVYLDAAKSHGGADGNNGSTPLTPVATLTKAQGQLGKSGGTIYVMSNIDVSTDTQLLQDNIVYKRYAKVAGSNAPDSYTGDLFTVSGGTLTITDTVIDGNAKNVPGVAGLAGRLIGISSNGTVAVTGITTLQNNAGYLISQGGTMTMTGTPVFDGIVYLAASKTIAVVPSSPLSLPADIPMTFEVEDPPTTEGAVRTLVTNTTLSVNSFTLIKDGYSLENQKVEIAGTPTDCMVMKLGGKQTTVYVDGLLGNDLRNGQTPANAVRSLGKAYEILKETGGCIVICDSIAISDKETITDSAVTEGNTTTALNSGNTVSIRRYAKPIIHSGDWSKDSYKGTLFTVTSGGKLSLESIQIDGHALASPSEPAVLAEAPLISVQACGQCVTNGDVILQNNSNTTGTIAGGAISNSGVTSLTGLLIKNTDAEKGNAIYQKGTLNVVSENCFNGLDIYLNNGKYITVTGNQTNEMIVTPTDKTVPKVVGKASFGTTTGETILGRFCLSDAFADYTMKADGQYVKMVKNLYPSSISLNDKTVDYTGNAVSIGEASVVGSKGAVTYIYYTDAQCTTKTNTTETGGRAAYSGAAPIQGGTYYVRASVAAKDNYAGATSNIAKLTVNLHVIYRENIPKNGVKSGTVPSNKTVYTEGSKVTVDTANAGHLAVAGYSLAGWSTTPTGTTVSSFNITDSVCTLYAIWTAKTKLVADDFKGKMNNKTYNGTSQSQIITTADGISSGETGDITVYYRGSGSTKYLKSITPPKNAGTYEILLDVAEGSKYASVKNLSIGTYELGKKSVTVSGIIGTDKVYNGKANATVNTASASLNGVINGESIGVSIRNPEFANADASNGKQINWQNNDIILTGENGAADNYTVATTGSQLSATANISQAMLTAAYQTETIAVNGIPAYHINVTGFVNGETPNSLGIYYTAPTVSGGDPAVIGTYILTPKNGTAKNYDFTYQSGTLNVVAKINNGGSNGNNGGSDGNNGENENAGDSGENIMSDKPANPKHPEKKIAPQLPTNQAQAGGNLAKSEKTTGILVEKPQELQQKLEGLLQVGVESNVTGEQKKAYLPISNETVLDKNGKVENETGAAIANLSDVITTLLSTSEQNELLAGEKVELRLQVISLENKKNVLSKNERIIIEKQIPKNYVMGEYLDINLLKLINNTVTQKIKKVDKNLQIVLNVPEDLISTDGERQYKIVRSHNIDNAETTGNSANTDNEEVTVLEDLDNNPDTITFETDRFSTYAIIYQELSASMKKPQGNTGSSKQLKDNNKEKCCPICGHCSQPFGICILIWLVILLATVIVIITISRLVKHKKKHLEKTSSKE